MKADSSNTASQDHRIFVEKRVEDLEDFCKLILDLLAAKNMLPKLKDHTKLLEKAYRLIDEECSFAELLGNL